MAKRDDRIITSVYLTKEMCDQIDKMADREHISRNEQIRRYIEKGLAVEGYSQDIDLIAGIIRQEMQAALTEAYTDPLNNNEITKAYQNRVPRQGEIPTPEEAVRYLAGKVKKNRA